MGDQVRGRGLGFLNLLQRQVSHCSWAWSGLETAVGTAVVKTYSSQIQTRAKSNQDLGVGAMYLQSSVRQIESILHDIFVPSKLQANGYLHPCRLKVKGISISTATGLS